MTTFDCAPLTVGFPIWADLVGFPAEVFGYPAFAVLAWLCKETLGVVFWLALGWRFALVFAFLGTFLALAAGAALLGADGTALCSSMIARCS